MYPLLIVLTILASVLLIGVVLIQKSKGGGLSSTFAGSNQVLGVRRTNNFIEKLTWSLAGAICVLAILSTFFMPNAIVNKTRVVAPAATEQTQGGNFDSKAPEAAAPAATPAPAAAPAETPAAPAAE